MEELDYFVRQRHLEQLRISVAILLKFQTFPLDSVLEFGSSDPKSMVHTSRLTARRLAGRIQPEVCGLGTRLTNKNGLEHRCFPRASRRCAVSLPVDTLNSACAETIPN